MIAMLLALALQATPDATLAGLERTYDETCNGRLYGQFDDMCSDMADRLKAYRAEVRRRDRSAAGNAKPPPTATPQTAARRAPVPDQASTPVPLPPADAAPAGPSPTGPGSNDSLVQAFEAVRHARTADGDAPDIAADDAGASSLAEKMGAGSQTP